MTTLDMDTLALIVRQSAAVTRSEIKRSPAWTEAEDQFVRENLGWMTDEEMGYQLGRSTIAVHLRWKRDLGLPGPSKAPDVLTAHKAAEILGIDGHKTAAWVDLGLIHGRVMAGGRNIRLIDRTVFRRWVLNPVNWVYFNPKKVRDPELRHMLGKRAARWGDEWWPTTKVAKLHGVATGDVKRYIQKGWLKSFRLPVSLGGRAHNRKWSNHFVLKSDALKVIFVVGRRGTRHVPLFTPAADAWILKAKEELGLTHAQIGRTMKVGGESLDQRGNPQNKKIAYRYSQLKKLEQPQKKAKRRAKRS